MILIYLDNLFWVSGADIKWKESTDHPKLPHQIFCPTTSTGPAQINSKFFAVFDYISIFRYLVEIFKNWICAH